MTSKGKSIGAAILAGVMFISVSNAAAQSSTGQDRTMSQGTSGHSGGMSRSMGTLNAQDREFVLLAAMGGMGEIEMARLALQRASSEAVKQYAQRMIDDHTKANEELMRLASAKGIMLPADMSAMMGGAHAAGAGNMGHTSAAGGAGPHGASAAGGMDAKHTSKMRNEHRKHMASLSRLQGLSGAEFDREYIRQAGDKDHQQQLKLFRREASRGGDAELRAFAAATAPVVQNHLSMARDLARTSRGGSMTMSGGNRNNQ